MRPGRLLLLAWLALLLTGCPPSTDDDDGFSQLDDDDSVPTDDDDSVQDDDDVVDDDDAGDDDDSVPTDDDDAGDDDDAVDDDDAGDDDDAVDDDDTAPDCPEDGFEPNDSQATAVSINSGSYAEMDACPGNSDWFEVMVSEGDSLSVQLVFGHADGDIDLAIHDVAGGVVASSASEDDNETASVTAGATTLYYVHVYLDGETDPVLGNEYMMELNVSTPVCSNDSFEPNDTQVIAAPLTPASYPGLWACSGDDDWYSVDLLAGQELTAALTFDQAEGDIDVELVDLWGTVLAAASTTTSDELLTWVAPADDTWWLHLQLVADTGSTPGVGYDLDLTIDVPTCNPDLYEPNDSQGAASPIAPATLYDLTACGDDDWFGVTLTAGDVLDVTALFAQAEGDLDLTLYDPSLNQLLVANSATDDETLTWTATTSGVHTLLVQLAADLGIDPGNDYDLDVQVTGVATCSADGFEPNDGQSSPTLLAPGSYPGLTGCPGDADWYSLSLVTGEALGASIAFAQAEGDLDLYLHDAGGSVLVDSTSGSDDEALGWVAASAGQYFVQVALVSDAGATPGNSYDLELTVTPAAATCPVDPAESDDFQPDGTLLPDGLAGETLGPFSACGDSDWFQAIVPGDSYVVWSALFPHAEGNVDAYLYDTSATLLQSGTSSSDDEVFSWTTGSQEEPAFLEVVLTADAGADPGNLYELSLTTAPAGACSVDGWEPNDSPLSAAPVWTASFSNLFACSPADPEFFQLEMAAGDWLSAVVSFDTAEGDLDVQVLDASGVVATSSTSSSPETVLHQATSSGTHWILVELVSDPGAGGCWFDLDVNGTPNCPDDDLEDDDSQEAALPFAPTSEARLACAGDDDWLVIWADSGQTLDASITFSQVEVDLDLELVDDSGALLAWSTSSSDDEALTHVAGWDGWYWLRTTVVADPGALGGDYTIGFTAW